MSLLSSSDMELFRNVFSGHFCLFATQNSGSYITVYKEPLKTISTLNINSLPNLAGYKSTQEVNYTYTPVSGRYPAMEIYSTKEDEIVQDTVFPANQVKIKVERDARNFIEKNKTIRIDFNGQSYQDCSYYGVQDYLGLKYYYYLLRLTN